MFLDIRREENSCVSSSGLGFASLNHNQKNSKAMKLEVLSVPVPSDLKPLHSKQLRPFSSCLLRPSSWT